MPLLDLSCSATEATQLECSVLNWDTPTKETPPLFGATTVAKQKTAETAEHQYKPNNAPSLMRINANHIIGF